MSQLDNLCFTTANFDRQALKRNDGAWLSKQLNCKDSLFLISWKKQFPVTESVAESITEEMKICFFDKEKVENYSQQPVDWIFLGVTKDNNQTLITVFGAELTVPNSKYDIENTDNMTEDFSWQTLRKIGLHLSAEEASLVVYAQGLFNWHSSHQFCNRCGAPLETIQAGHALVCSAETCASEIFPRTDPAIIVLVEHEDACLLGRAATWPEGMFSCLAGFVETGEDLQAAVRREVFEESGINIGKINFKGSQPWPFPQSLMFGFQAEATSKELTFHDGEIDEAIWLTREQVIEYYRNEKLKLSSSLSISYHLIEDWFNQKSEKPLADYLLK